MQTKPRARFAVSELVVGLLLLAAAGVILFDAQRLPAGAMYGVGPAAAPTLIAGGMILLGLVTLVAAWRGGEDAEAEEGSLDGSAVIIIMLSLAALIALMTLGGGFIAASAVLFAGTAWAFGRRALFADIAIGLVLALVIYTIFTKLLTLALPEGPFERVVLRGLDVLGQWIGLLAQCIRTGL